MSHYRKIIAGCFLLFLILRFLTLLTASSTVYKPDELYQGYLAEELIHGIKGAYVDYQIDAYTGGSLLTGAVSALFFKVLDPSLFALKLSALLFDALLWCLSIFFLFRYFGIEAGVFGAFLMTFPLPVFYHLGLIASGSHRESLVFLAAHLICFVESSSKPNSKLKLGAALGLFGSLAVWLSYLNFIPAGLIIFLTCLQSRKDKGHFLFWVGIGFLLGMVPWLAYNFRHHFSGLEIFCEGVRNITDFTEQNNISTLWEFFTIPLALSGNVTTAPLPLWLNTLVFLSYLPFYYYFVSTLSKSSARFFLIAFPVVMTVFLAFFKLTHSWDSDFDAFRFRYVSSLYWILMIGGSVGASRMKRLGTVSFVILTGLNAAIILGQLCTEPFGFSFTRPGYSIEDRARFWRSSAIHFSKGDKIASQSSDQLLAMIHQSDFWSKNIRDIDKETVMKALPQEQRHFIFKAAGINHQKYWNGTLKDLPRVPAWIPESHAADYYYGIFSGVSPFQDSKSFFKDASLGQQYPTKLRPWYFFNMGKKWFDWDSQNFRLTGFFPDETILNEEFSLEDLKWFYRGMGAGYLQHEPNLWRLRAEVSGVTLQGLPKQQAMDFWWGLGWDLRERYGDDDRIRFKEDTAQLAVPHHFQWVRAGFEAYQQFWGEGSKI